MNDQFLKVHMVAQTALLRLIAKVLIEGTYKENGPFPDTLRREELFANLHVIDDLVKDTPPQESANPNE